MKNLFSVCAGSVFLMIVLSACSKNDKITIARIAKVVTQKQTGASDTAYFSYNANGELSELQLHDSAGIQSSFDITYNNLQAQSISKSERIGNLIEKTATTDLFITSTGQLALAVTAHLTGTGEADSLKFGYNEFGNLSRILDVVSTSQSTSITIYSLTVTGSNLTQIVKSDSDLVNHTTSVTGTSTYTYDSKKNPFYNLVLPLFIESPFANSYFYFSVNNAITGMSSGGIDDQQNFTSSFQYDTNNDPISEISNISTFGGTSVITRQFFYENVSF